VARLLILGGGCRGRRLAGEVLAQGHAARIVTRAPARRAEIEATGAECLVGDPNRLGSLRGALAGVTVACWLLGTAGGPPEEVRELHESRLPAFLAQAVDSPMRAFLYEAPPHVRGGIQELARANAIVAHAVTVAPGDADLWLGHMRDTLSPFL
jgi:uncharacterized protein YbjT (DUF2867 family)